MLRPLSEADFPEDMKHLMPGLADKERLGEEGIRVRPFTTPPRADIDEELTTSLEVDAEGNVVARRLPHALLPERVAAARTPSLGSPYVVVAGRGEPVMSSHDA